MNKKDLAHFREKLAAEKTLLEQELSGIAERNPNNPNEWNATPGSIQVDSADENEVADKFEEVEENENIIVQLEKQLNEVKAAMERIEKGTYGNCEVCGEPIERERLEANSSARISIKHKHPAQK